MQTSFLVLLSVCATCAALHHQPTAASAFNKRWRVSAAPVAAFSDFQGADSFSSITQQLGEMAQQGMGMAARGAQDLTPIVQSGAEQAAPVIKSSVMGFAEIAGRTAAKVSMGVEASMPVLGQAAEETLPVLGKAAEEASKVLSKAAETGSQALGSQIRSSLTSEQLAQLDEAARRGGQVGEVVSGVAVKTAKTSTELAKVAAPVVQQGIKVGVEKGVPLAGELARKTVTAVDSGVRDVTPVVDELLRSGKLEPATVERVEGGIIGALQGGVREIGRGLRTVADVVAPDASDGSVRGSGASRSSSALVPLPSTKEVTDSLATSFVQASAPYAFGALLLSFALSALRELLEPLEQAVRRALAAAFLVLLAKFASENWDQIYSVYEYFASM